MLYLWELSRFYKLRAGTKSRTERMFESLTRSIFMWVPGNEDKGTEQDREWAKAGRSWRNNMPHVDLIYIFNNSYIERTWQWSFH